MVELANKLTEMDEVVFAFPNFVSEFKRSLQARRRSRHNGIFL